MRVCDFCRSENLKGTIEIKDARKINTNVVFTSNYELCGQCFENLMKWVKIGLCGGPDKCGEKKKELNG